MKKMEMMKKAATMGRTMVKRAVMMTMAAAMTFGTIAASPLTTITAHASEEKFVFNYKDAEESDTNIKVYTKVKNPDRRRVTDVGIKVWNEDDGTFYNHAERCDRKESSFNIWYDFAGELGMDVESGTNYSYQFYIMYDASLYYGEKVSCKTTGKKVCKYLQDTDQGDGNVSAANETVSKDANAVIPQTTNLENYLGMMHQIMSFTKSEVYNEIGTPIQIADGKEYFDKQYNALFQCPVELEAIFYGDDLGVMTWKYTYPNSAYASDAEVFYNQLIPAGNNVIGYNATMTNEGTTKTALWNGNLTVQITYAADGTPTVEITTVG